MTSVFRAPNVEGSAKDKVQAELDILLEEFAYSPGFKLFLNEIVIRSLWKHAENSYDSKTFPNLNDCA